MPQNAPGVGVLLLQLPLGRFVAARHDILLLSSGRMYIRRLFANQFQQSHRIFGHISRYEESIARYWHNVTGDCRS